MTEDRVVILTALNLEYEAVQQRLTDLHVYRHPQGTRFETGVIHGTKCRVALGLTGKGTAPAAVLSERAIQAFSPLAVLFVGVAGALWDGTPLGDVVMATHIYAYHGGTSADDGLKARPRAWEAAHRILQLASHISRSNDWAGQVPSGGRAAKVHFGPIAAGEVVHTSRISYEARWIREHYNDALAIEMESAGVAQACHLSSVPVAVIRGISDMADGTKSSSGDGTWQPRAAANAAAFAIRLAEELITEQHVPTPGTGSTEGRVRRFTDGTLRLSWVRGDDVRELILETDDFDVSLGRNATNRVRLPDHRDGRFHGHLVLVGATFTYLHLSRHPAYLVGATRQLTIAEGESCPVGDKDRLQFASGTMLVEFSAPDLYDPNAGPTSTES